MHRWLFVAVAVLVVSVQADAQAAPSSRAGRDSSDLVALNRGYVDSFINGDAAWYDAHLAAEFVCFCPDGSIVKRADFLRSALKPMTYKTFLLDSVSVRIVGAAGDVALIGAITPWERADGTRGVSRYTDTWVRRDGQWKTLRAQITPIRNP